MPAYLDTPELSHALEQFEHSLRDIFADQDGLLATEAARLITAGGKRLRPALLMAVCLSYGKTIDERILACCRAVELVHLGTVVHDDIIDGAERRRGQGSSPQDVGLAQALLVGDYLLATASQEAAAAGTTCADLLAQTIVTMCKGQSQEIEQTYNTTTTPELYLSTISQKTGSLFAAACQFGALQADRPQPEIRKWQLFGDNLGISFQLADDLLDIVSDEATLGKPVWSDIPNGVYGAAVLHTLASKQRTNLIELLPMKRGDTLAKAELVDLLTVSGTFTAALSQITSHNSAAGVALEELPKSAILTELSNLPGRLLEELFKKDILGVLK